MIPFYLCFSILLNGLFILDEDAVSMEQGHENKEANNSENSGQSVNYIIIWGGLARLVSWPGYRASSLALINSTNFEFVIIWCRASPASELARL